MPGIGYDVVFVLCPQVPVHSGDAFERQPPPPCSDAHSWTGALTPTKLLAEKKMPTGSASTAALTRGSCSTGCVGNSLLRTCSQPGSE